MTTQTIEQQESGRTLKSFFPILEWLPRYEGSWLRFDVIAALTLWAVLVPEAMAYAGIAGMPKSGRTALMPSWPSKRLVVRNP